MTAGMFACSKEYPGDDSVKQPTHPPIEPLPGMDLYGSIIDDAGNPVTGVVVSDGYQCVLTDAKGIYQINAIQVHFISLDNVLYSNNSAYTGGLEDFQIEWLRQDLNHVWKSTVNCDNKHAYLHTLKNANARTIEIRATDKFGKTYSQTEIISNFTTAEKY
jgi:hypothetical protein